MKESFKTVLVLVLMTSANAHASVFTRTMLGAALQNPSVSPMIEKNSTKLRTASAAPLGCTDFSGSWKGTCTDAKSGGRDSSLEIKQQGCQYINMDKEEYELGALKSRVATGTTASVEAISLFWSPDQKSLNFKMAYMLAELHRSAVLVSGGGEIVRSGDQLMVSQETSGLKTSCVYQKQ